MIIGYDAFGNPVYSESSSPGSSSGVGSGTNTNKNQPAGGGGTSNKPTGAKGSSNKPAGGGSVRPGAGMISSKNAPRNLQGAPQATALKILGANPAPAPPTQAELDALENPPGTTNVGGGGGDPYANLLKALTGLGNYSADNINSSMNNLQGFLAGQTNPYAGFQAQSMSTTPELSQLLQSQGVDTNPLQQFAAAINAQNMGQASAFQNQANTMRDIYTANQRGSMADVAQQRADLLNQLQGNVLGAGKSLFGKKAPQRNSILQMILEAMKVQR